MITSSALYGHRQRISFMGDRDSSDEASRPKSHPSLQKHIWQSKHCSGSPRFVKIRMFTEIVQNADIQTVIFL